MKRPLLLFALNCYALTLPSINNLAIWESSNKWQTQKRHEFAFRYSEPFEKFHNGKFDIAWSDGHFLAAAGFGGASLDSIYRELEFSAFFALKPLDILSLSLSETANLSWVPENGSWQEHVIFARADFFYKNWSRFSFTQIMHKEEKMPFDSHWLLACEFSFNELYSFGIELPLNEKRGMDFRIYQQINLGYFGVYNSFAYPGPELGFGFAVNMQNFSVGAGHLRGNYPNGHTGYTVRWQKR